MESEVKIYIDDEREYDRIKIFFVKTFPGGKIFYHFTDGVLTETEHRPPIGSFEPMKPFLELPGSLGRLFLSVLNDEIEKKGINTRKVDMQAGKTELLEHRLKFSDDQLVKFIDYFTTPPSTNE